MAEYIEKQRAKDLMGCCLASAKAQYKAEKNEFKKSRYGDYISTIQAMIDVVGAVEAADVQPVKRGHWIVNEAAMDYVDKNGVEHHHGMCSECKLIYDFVDLAKWFNFCPECGADMREHKAIKG